MSLFEEVIKECVSYIWDELQADTIRIDLYHYQQKDTDGLFKSELKANPDIKEALIMKKQGFKWKTMLNTVDGRH